MARNASIASRRTSATVAGGQIGGNHRLRSLVQILRFVVVELARRDDLAGHRGLRIVVAEHRAFDLARVRAPRLRPRPCDRTASAISIAGTSSAGVFTFEMPTLDPRLAGFTNTGRPSVLDRRQHRVAIAIPLGADEAVPVADRQAARGEQHLHHRLVHARRRRQHAGTDIRNVGQFEQALHRAVFAVRAVQHRKHHVELERRQSAGSFVPCALPRRAAAARACWITSAADIAVGG